MCDQTVWMSTVFLVSAQINIDVTQRTFTMKIIGAFWIVLWRVLIKIFLPESWLQTGSADNHIRSMWGFLSHYINDAFDVHFEKDDMGGAVRYSEETSDMGGKACRWTDRQINWHKLMQKTRAQNSSRLLEQNVLTDDECTSIASLALTMWLFPPAK